MAISSEKFIGGIVAFWRFSNFFWGSITILQDSTSLVLVLSKTETELGEISRQSLKIILFAAWYIFFAYSSVDYENTYWRIDVILDSSKGLIFQTLIINLAESRFQKVSFDKQSGEDFILNDTNNPITYSSSLIFQTKKQFRSFDIFAIC